MCGCISKEKEDEVVQLNDDFHLAGGMSNDAELPEASGRGPTPAVDLELEFNKMLAAVVIPNEDVGVSCITTKLIDEEKESGRVSL